MFILSQQRDSDGWDGAACANAFAAYEAYLASSAEKFPPSAYALATSGWYYSGNDPRSPHDARLKTCEIKEVRRTRLSPQHTIPSIKIRLAAAYGGTIEFHYPKVFNFDLKYAGKIGHGDWLYDEFRVTENGVIHEIEWRAWKKTCRWKIEASDVIYKHKPLWSSK